MGPFGAVLHSPGFNLATSSSETKVCSLRHSSRGRLRELAASRVRFGTLPMEGKDATPMVLNLRKEVSFSSFGDQASVVQTGPRR
jgi:hypothetical protein